MASLRHRGSPYGFSGNGGSSFMRTSQTSTSSSPYGLNSSRFLPRPSPNRSAARGLAQVIPRNSPPVMYNASEGGDPDESADFSDPSKENICVTIRFRPLSERESLRGDEAVWYVEENTVRNEYNPSAAYAYDKVFGATTSTRSVYDTAARHVVRGSMEGINGTVFAYGVTSSGKTHTMHGDPNFPGVIPLAVKDVFSIIQETPGREFLLRVTYLEIYNEVINDLLDPAGQNLRIREDAQGTYVEGVKEEVVLSPSHALSLIAAGEEHRHVGSNNFNLFSSRSHTIFTLTIESSVRGRGSDDEVTLSQLNLIDLAGSESSKTETTGLRRKEGSYINKSLLTLGTVISKLSEGRASHIPYRDSKLTRLLQSSLSGYGRISLICTITPASSNMEETHNTLKFAQRAKRIAIYAAANRIIDERSLIKKYQKEIATLRQELQYVKRGMIETPYPEDLMTLRQQLEAGQMKMQSRLEEEEQAKAALMGRIHKLTKLILVSTKNNLSGTGHQRRSSMAESEERYDDQSDVESSSYVPENSPGNDICSEAQRNENFADQIDLTREQVKMLAGEIALRSSSLKRLSDQAAHKPDDPQIQVQMKILKEDIEDKMNQMELLEQRVMELGDSSSSYQEMSQMLAKIKSQLNEKSFELEIRTADNRILEEQLKSKVSEIEELEEQNARLQQQLQEALQKASYQKPVLVPHNCSLDDDHGENRRAVKRQDPGEALLQAEVEILSQDKARLQEEKKLLVAKSTKLEEDANYAKDLAASAATEIKGLTEQVKKLLLQNTKLANDAESMSSEVYSLRAEVQSEREKRSSMEQSLSDKDKVETELRKKVEEAKQREADLENDMAKMWIQIAKLKAGGESLIQNSNIPPTVVEVTTSTLNIRRIKDQHKELEKLRAADKDDASAVKTLVSQLKEEDVDGLDASALEDLQAMHIEALTKLCSAKARIQERRKETRPETREDVGSLSQLYDEDDRRSHICKICFEAQTAAVLLPCRHFCLCQQCAVACTECPLCRSYIDNRIITFAS